MAAALNSGILRTTALRGVFCGLMLMMVVLQKNRNFRLTGAVAFREKNRLRLSVGNTFRFPRRFADLQGSATHPSTSPARRMTLRADGQRGFDPLNTYELVIIFSPLLSEQQNQEKLDQLKGVLTQNAAVIQKEDIWGKRRLAYPIAKQREGVYVLIQFEAPTQGSCMAELERFCKIDETILRHMVTRAVLNKSLGTPQPRESRREGQGEGGGWEGRQGRGRRSDHSRRPPRSSDAAGESIPAPAGESVPAPAAAVPLESAAPEVAQPEAAPATDSAS